MKRIAIALLLGLMLLLAGCTSGGVSESAENKSHVAQDFTKITDERVAEDGKVYRFTDTEAGVTCWVYGMDNGDGGQGGMSCIPTSETTLSEERF